VPIERFQRAHLDLLLLLGGRLQIDPDQAEQRPKEALAIAAAKLRILFQVGVADHLQQHVVGGDDAGLALHHHRKAGHILGARRQLAIDELQFAGIDIELGGGGVFRRHALADRHCRAGEDQRGRHDRGLALPEQLDQFEHAEARRRGCRRPGFRLRPLYRLVIVKHGPQLPFELPHATAEGSLFGSRPVRRKKALNKRNKKN